MRRWTNDTGTVTAEFATVMPAVILILACCLSAMQVSAQQLRVQDAAASAARSAARGDSLAGASGLIAHLTLTVTHRADLVCVTASAPAAAANGLIAALTLTATSCALGGGV